MRYAMLIYDSVDLHEGCILNLENLVIKKDNKWKNMFILKNEICIDVKNVEKVMC